jgi:hypothetical protein
MAPPPATQGRAKQWPEPQAERSDGPNGTVPCAPAEERSARGCARAPCASITDSLRLFELSERSERCELRNAAHGASTAGCPERSGGTGAPGSPSLCLLSLGEARESKSGCGGEAPTSSPRSDVVFPAGARGRDVRPAAQSLSFVSPKESNQRKGGPGPHDPPLALRATCGARGLGASCNSLRSLRSLRSDKHDESDVEARGSPRRPVHCAPRRGHRGPGSGVTAGPSLRSAPALHGQPT